MIRIPLSDLRAFAAPLLKLATACRSLPVLAHVLVSRKANVATFSATDLSRWLDHHHVIEPMPLTTLQAKLAALRWARETGPDFLVPVSALRDVLRAAKGGDVTLRKDGIEYDLAGAPATLAFEAPDVAEFVPRPEGPGGMFWDEKPNPSPTLPLDALDRDAFVQAIPFAPEQDTSVLHGIHLNATDGHITGASNHRIFQHATLGLAKLGGSVIVPLPTAAILATPALAELPWQLTLFQLPKPDNTPDASASHLRLRFDCGAEWTLFSRCADGIYPSIRHAIPGDLADYASVAITEETHRGLTRLLAGLPPLNPKRPEVCLTFQPDAIDVRDEGSKVAGTVPGACEHPQSVLVNRDALKAALAACPRHGGATLHFLDPSSPLVVTVPAGVVVLAPFKPGIHYAWPAVRDPARDALAAIWQGKKVEVHMDGGDTVLGEVIGVVRTGKTHRAEVRVLDKRETILTPDELTVSFTKLTEAREPEAAVA